jgi:hypothetical protein
MMGAAGSKQDLGNTQASPANSVRLSKMSAPKKPNNVRTGLLVGLLALSFFIAIFVKMLWFK